MLRYRFTAEEFHRMAEAGILPEDARVELVEGEIVTMSPVGKRHMAAVKRLMDLLFPLQQARKALLQVQDPLRLSPESEPQPDLTLLSYRENFYRDKVPEAEDALLVIEVADTSLDYDLTVKLPLYAKAGIPEVWVVDLEGGQVLVHREPKGEGYREVRTLGPGDTLAFMGVEIPVEVLL
ncbi:Uma2 family endonuclease [Thermus sp. NEB1569]|uniref:Uma2 family endonuclease n=1 Tax=Thermus sp. NEB1569 TaxID=2918899 RepID=UPI001EFBAB05|nr:Uma2 family endonuclease [Thermus sp. NEB1569]ULR41534.1 Uma2 family endonuclease [Thermus sp. NEB1569]